MRLSRGGCIVSAIWAKEGLAAVEMWLPLIVAIPLEARSTAVVLLILASCILMQAMHLTTSHCDRLCPHAHLLQFAWFTVCHNLLPSSQTPHTCHAHSIGYTACIGIHNTDPHSLDTSTQTAMYMPLKVLLVHWLIVGSGLDHECPDSLVHSRCCLSSETSHLHQCP